MLGQSQIVYKLVIKTMAFGLCFVASLLLVFSPTDPSDPTNARNGITWRQRTAVRSGFGYCITLVNLVYKVVIHIIHQSSTVIRRFLIIRNMLGVKSLSQKTSDRLINIFLIQTAVLIHQTITSSVTDRFFLYPDAKMRLSGAATLQSLDSQLPLPLPRRNCESRCPVR